MMPALGRRGCQHCGEVRIPAIGDLGGEVRLGGGLPVAL